MKNQTEPFKLQLLKWVGNKQRVAHHIVNMFPSSYRTYWEPFLGSGAVLGTLQPRRAVGSDSFLPLIGIWEQLHADSATLVEWYRERYEEYMGGENRKEAYEVIKTRYNSSPNPADFLFLTRSCYGGVIRFRKDGYMSTPCGAHMPISPESFQHRVTVWHERTRGTMFRHCDYREVFERAQTGDLIYCDPPYVDSQAILYGAQQFSFQELLERISDVKKRGVNVVLSIDGTKKSGQKTVLLNIPDGLLNTKRILQSGNQCYTGFRLKEELL